MATGPHVSISSETVGYIGSFPISNSMVTSLVVSSLILLFAVIVRIRLKPNSIKPTGIQNFAEWIVESLYNLVHSIAGGPKKAALFFPVAATFFLFILMNNWFGLLPVVGTIVVPAPHERLETATTHAAAPLVPQALADTHDAVDATEVVVAGEMIQTEQTDRAIDEELGISEGLTESETTGHISETVTLFRPATADLNMTLALAIISVVMIQVFGVKYLSIGYFKKFFNFSGVINFYVGILELISEFAKIISFAFRLFGNVFAGEVLLVVITYLTKILIPVPFYGLEVFVGFIQAFVFAMLSLVFFNMATQKEH